MRDNIVDYSIFNPNLKGYSFVLGSKSPRRKQLLEEMGLPFTVELRPIDESSYTGISTKETALMLAQEKAKPFLPDLAEKQIVITADTLVVLKDEILGKPSDEAQAIEMLQKLSGEQHEVITGVSLLALHRSINFSVTTQVYFRSLSLKEIEYYVKNYRPLDKAGAYGIQEWIGCTSVYKIEGSFYNVMGMPVEELFSHLKHWH